MDEFMLIFRRDHETKENQPSPEDMQASIKEWLDWKGSLAAQNKLVSQGNRLRPEGKVIKSDKVVINGPYAEIKEAIGGFIVIRAGDYDEAVELARDCPILRAPWNGSVEVRMLVSESNS
jgi:hypothetical protein